jgi:hypothetical protein
LVELFKKEELKKMKHNKMFILFPFVFSMAVILLVVFSCYPGVGPGADNNWNNNNGDGGDRIVIPNKEIITFNTRSSAIMPVMSDPTDPRYQIFVTVTKDGIPVKSRLSYETSAPGVATVSNLGIVTANTPGDAEITITSEGGGEAVFTAMVRKLDILPLSATIRYGDDPLKMQAIIQPTGEALGSLIYWGVYPSLDSIPDPLPDIPATSTNFATIDGSSGVLTAKNLEGSVDVVTRSTYGNLQQETPALIKVLPESEITTPTIKIDQGLSKMIASTETLPLSAKVNDQSNQPITWSVGSYSGNTFTPDNTVASVGATGTVTPIKTGDVVVRAYHDYLGTLSDTSDDAVADFVVYVRKLDIGPDSLSLELLSGVTNVVGGLLDTVGGLLGGLLGGGGSGDTAQDYAGAVDLAAVLSGGTSATEASNLRWEIVSQTGLQLLSDVVIDPNTGILAIHGALLNLNVIQLGAGVTVKATSLDNPKLFNTIFVPVDAIL